MKSVYYVLFVLCIRYPSRNVYNRVCSSIVLKYPFLADFDGTTVSNIYHSVSKTALSCKPKTQFGRWTESSPSVASMESFIGDVTCLLCIMLCFVSIYCQY